MTHHVYLPIVSSSHFAPCILGAQIEGAVEGVGQWIIKDRIYHWPVYWCEVEKERGEYIWPEVYDTNARALAEYPIIITIKRTPPWAQKWDDVASPPDEKYYPNLRNFIRATSDRYHPWAIEFYNEPDCVRGQGYAPMYGAWVDINETWWQGGTRYGEACKAMYPLPVKMLGGALMMNDDSLEFLDGALAAGMQADALSFHCYLHSREEFDRPFELASQLRVRSSLPLMITETSVLSHTNDKDEATEEFEQMQADYLSHAIAGMGWNELEYIGWYTLANNNWCNSDLQRGDDPTPAYRVWANR
jgi:hypothetical protein